MSIRRNQALGAQRPGAGKPAARLKPSSLLLGRSAECDVYLDHDTVSRRHARISATGDGRLRVEDLGSSNGTWRAHHGRWRAVRDESLAPETRIRFGEQEILLAQTLAAWSGLWLTQQPASIAPPPKGPVRLPPAEAGLDRPRRNPDTGDIEERD